MTFLNPFVLFGLAAAAIPILLHLLNIRKLRTIEFSSLQFLKELQKNTMRKIQVRQWLLLALRTLLILCVVLAFSRPALRGTLAGLGTHAKTTVVLIIDNTYSMSLNNENGTFIKQAQNSAHRLITMLKEGDDAIILVLSDVSNATMTEPTHDTKKLHDVIQNIEPSYKRVTIEDAMRLASRLLRQSKNFNKEIYVLTDGQRSTLLSDALNANTRDLFFESTVKTFVLPFSEKQFENTGVTKVLIPPSLVHVGKPFTVQATVKNFGTQPVQNHLVGLFLNNVRVMQKSISLEAGASSVVEFSIMPRQTGFLSCFIDLEDDGFDADNKFFFSVYIPGNIDVLLVSPDAKGATTYITLALTASHDDTTSVPLRVTETTPAQMSYSLLAKHDVVILNDIKEFSTRESELLVQFLSGRSGGVLMFPNSEMNNQNPNSELFVRLGLPPLQPLQTQPKDHAAFISFDKIDFDHPVFKGMFEQKELHKTVPAIESPQIFSSLTFTSEKNIRSIISLSNNSSFMWEKNIGSGKIIGFAVPANIAWSNFPLTNIFVPLLYQSVLYLGSGENTAMQSATAHVGETIDARSTSFKQKENSPAVTNVEVVPPEGATSIIQPYKKEFVSLYSIPLTSSAGIYAIKNKKDTVALLAANVDSKESDGSRFTNEDVQALCTRYNIEKNNVHILRVSDAIENIVLQSRFGVELWKYFLLLAVFVALVEMFVARAKNS